MKQVWSVGRVASWDGWCSPCSRDDRPLVLTRSGPSGVRAWVSGIGDDERCLLLTCRVCGQWQLVPLREEDDPEVVPDEQTYDAAAEVLRAATAAVPALPVRAAPPLAVPVAAPVTVPAQAAVPVAVPAQVPAVAALEASAAASAGQLPSGPPAEASTPVRCPAAVLAALAPQAVAATTALGRRSPAVLDDELRGVADPFVPAPPLVTPDARVAAQTVLSAALHGTPAGRLADHSPAGRRESRRHDPAPRPSHTVTAPARAVVPAPRTAPQPTSLALPAGTAIDLVTVLDR